MNNPLKIAIHTLGCKVNRCDSEDLAAELIKIGYEIVDFKSIADVYIINTCTVTMTSDKKSRNMITRAKRRNKQAFVAVCGCMTGSTKISGSEIAGADYLFDARKPVEFLYKLVEISTAPYVAEIGNTAPTNPLSRTRVNLKIQDGCDRFCAYCIVPYVRGTPTSYPLNNVLHEAHTHILNGVKEIVLTGIQVASYGTDLSPDVNLPVLIQELSNISGAIRIRLSSIDPWAIDDAFLNAITQSKNFCDHFHLSLQSGSDKILHAMNRRYTTNEYTNAIHALRKVRPNAAFTTDIIVGFPGETDEDFMHTCDFIRQIQFMDIHVFEYSPRPSTKAYDMPEQVDAKVKSERSKILRNLASDMKYAFFSTQLSKPAQILVEDERQQEDHYILTGHTGNYCPIQILSTRSHHNEIIEVIPHSINDDYLRGNCI